MGLRKLNDKRKVMLKQKFEIDKEGITIENHLDVYYAIKIPVTFVDGQKGIIAAYDGLLEFIEEEESEKK